MDENILGHNIQSRSCWRGKLGVPRGTGVSDPVESPGQRLDATGPCLTTAPGQLSLTSGFRFASYDTTASEHFREVVLQLVQQRCFENHFFWCMEFGQVLHFLGDEELTALFHLP